MDDNLVLLIIDILSWYAPMLSGYPISEQNSAFE
jgi:hypothetical protein